MAISDIPSLDYPTIIKKTVKWYQENHEPFPWRANRDPYRVWVSEVMLQQTTVKTVIPYFDAFLQEFPTVESLAKADIEKVLTQWQGLGYYRRARMLHQAAKKIALEFQGVFPRILSEIEALPGIGNYTAKAISSISYNDPFVPLDGNGIRVLGRLTGLKKTALALQKDLKEVVENLENSFKDCDAFPRFFAQGLMDLGRDVCKPLNPLCLACPVQEHCHGFKNDSVSSIPLRIPKNPLPLRYANAYIFMTEGKVLLEKRQEKGVLQGLWGVPMTGFSEEPQEEMAGTLHFSGKVTHVFTHFKLFVDVYSIQKVKEAPSILRENAIWVQKDELKNYAISTLMKKVLALPPKHPILKVA